MRPEGLLLIADSLTDQYCHDQRRYAGAGMDDDATGKIEGAQIFQPASHSPNPVTQRIVDKGRPENCEKKKGGKFDPFRKGANNQAGVMTANMH